MEEIKVIKTLLYFTLREMRGKVGSAPACYDSSLGLNPDISQKYKMGDISITHSSPPKKYTKNFTN